MAVAARVARVKYATCAQAPASRGIHIVHLLSSSRCPPFVLMMTQCQINDKTSRRHLERDDHGYGAAERHEAPPDGRRGQPERYLVEQRWADPISRRSPELPEDRGSGSLRRGRGRVVCSDA